MAIPYTTALLWNNASDATLADGVVVTPANSGGDSGTPFAVQKVSAGQITYESTGALQGLSYLVAASGGICMLRWDAAIVGDQDDLYGVTYVRYAAWPSAYSPFMEAKQTDGGALNFRLLISSAGNLRLVNSSNGTVFSTTTPLTLNQWWRIEWHINCITGLYEVWWYLQDSTTAVDQRSGTDSFGASIAQINYGRGLAPDYTALFGLMAVGTSKLGPRALPSATAQVESVTSNPDGWSASAGSTILGALSDATDATYIQTPVNPSADAITFLMQAMSQTEIATVQTRNWTDDDTTPITRTITIKNGATTLKTDSFVLTEVPTARTTATPAAVTAGVKLTVIISDTV